MSQRAAVPFRKMREWAVRRHVLEAAFSVGESSRLADFCRSPELGGRVEARWSFEPGLEGFPVVSLAASGALQLECQRCLTPVSWPFQVSCRLTVLGSESELRNVASPYDAVVAGPQGLVLGTILEDEILTSLPMAPTHEQCPAARDAAVHSSPDTCRPLAGLGALMRQTRD